MSLQSRLSDFITALGGAVKHIHPAPTADVEYRYLLGSNGTDHEWFPKRVILSGATITLNSAVFSTVPGFTFDVQAGEVWFFSAEYRATSLNAAADLRGNVIGPAVAADSYHALSNLENASGSAAAIGTQTTNIAVATSANDVIRQHGVIQPTAAGTVELQLRNNSGTTVQTFSSLSYLMIERWR